MDVRFDKKQNVLFGAALELAADIAESNNEDQITDLVEDIWFEMCEEEGIDPYA